MMVTFPAPAKLNLFLHITGRRDDGYHRLQTLFRFLDYADELKFVLRNDGKLSLKCSGFDIKTAINTDEGSDDNLALRAAWMLKRFCSNDKGVDIHLHKKIPPGAGLGGGSSDAATVLSVLNRQWDCGLTAETLADLGRSLGADVPAFLNGMDAWGEGVGDELCNVSLPPAWYLVWVPAQMVSTQKMYASPELKRDCDTTTLSDYQSGECINVFEPVVRQCYVEIADLMDTINARPGYGEEVKLSGTGGGFFIEFTDEYEANSALREKPDNVFAFVAKADGRSPLLCCLDKMR